MAAIYKGLELMGSQVDVYSSKTNEKKVDTHKIFVGIADMS